MYAVIRNGGKQYRVKSNDVVTLEHINANTGDKITLDDVLLIGETGKEPIVGLPLVEGASVNAEIIEQTRNAKIDVVKFKRRKNYHRLYGHKQHVTKIRIMDIVTKAKKKNNS